MALRAMLCGFPKSGSTTISKALRSANIKTQHAGNHVYAIEQAWYAGRDPFGSFPKIEAFTECLRSRVRPRSWLQFDLAFLLDVRRWHPDALLILNTRDPDKLLESITAYGRLRYRFIVDDLPGFGNGQGETDEEFRAFILAHYERVRMAFKDDPRFLEVDIEDPDAPDKIGRALGARIRWWGKENSRE